MRRIIAFMLLLSAPAVAQSPYGTGGMGNGTGRSGMGDTPRPTTIMDPLPSPEDLAGPAIPDFMVATKALRDTASAVRQHIDQLWQSGDRESARAYFPMLRRLGDRLAKEDDHFDDRVKKIFTKPHFKDYKDWRSDQRKQAEEDRKERMKQLTGTNPGR
jgi:hypothetical protein